MASFFLSSSFFTSSKAEESIEALFVLTTCVSLLNDVALTGAEAIRQNADTQETISDNQVEMHYETYTAKGANEYKLDRAQRWAAYFNPMSYLQMLFTLHNFIKDKQPTMDTDTLHHVQTNNSDIDGARDQMNVSLGIMRQTAALQTTQTQTDASAATQTMQTASGILDLLSALTKLICR